MATALTAAIVAFYAVHLAGVALPLGAGARTWSAVIILLSLAECAAGGGIAADEPGHYGRALFSVAALLGVVAFVAGVAALVLGSYGALAVLVVCAVALWAVAMVRHQTAGRPVSATGG